MGKVGKSFVEIKNQFHNQIIPICVVKLKDGKC